MPESVLEIEFGPDAQALFGLLLSEWDAVHLLLRQRLLLTSHLRGDILNEESLQG